MQRSLPRLRRKRRFINLASIAARFSKGVAKVEATIEPFAAWWDEHNHRTLESDGPLWVALGDSVTQGIGATDPTRSYAARTLDRLRADTGEPWRLINLAMSGARFEDVVERQLAVVDDFALQPQLISAVIGSNDVIWRRNTDAIIADARDLLGALPSGTVLSRLSEARPDRRRLGVNQLFDAAAEAGHVRLYEAWDWPSGHEMWAEDNFHPNDRAYGHLADNLYSALHRHRLL